MNGEEIAFVDVGDAGAPAALFVHGVLVNADLWRNVIFDVADLRRCVAVDLPAHGASPAGSDAADLSLTGLATMLDGLCAVLSLDQVDVVANDTGGAVARRCSRPATRRVSARSRSPTATCTTTSHPSCSSRSSSWRTAGEFGPMVAAMAGDLSLARSETGLGMGYVGAAQLSDEVVTSYLGPFVADQGKGLERILTSASADELMGVEPLLAQLAAPAQVAWGTADVFFGPEWAERLRELIPSVERVTLVPDAMLFWPDERAADLVPLLRDFWEAHA